MTVNICALVTSTSLHQGGQSRWREEEARSNQPGPGGGGDSALSSPAPTSSRGPRDLHCTGRPRLGRIALPKQLPTTSRHGEAWPSSPLCWSCYLNSTGFRGEGQQPPRRALQSDGFWGQTGWRPPYVIDAEKELKVRMAPINTLALSL